MTLSQAIPSGTLLGRDFEIIRVISQGGMGTVYEAIQRTTGAPRAVKIMRGGIAGDLRFRARFEQEARVSARIPSDHIVQVVSAGVDEVTGVPWIAMELLEGEDLANFLQRRGRMDVHNARLAIGQLCHALAAAHSVGVVHRDLKPENVFLGKARVVGVPFLVKVLDFGVAKILNEARAATIAVGTPVVHGPRADLSHRGHRPVRRRLGARIAGLSHARRRALLARSLGPRAQPRRALARGPRRLARHRH